MLRQCKGKKNEFTMYGGVARIGLYFPNFFFFCSLVFGCVFWNHCWYPIFSTLFFLLVNGMVSIMVLIVCLGSTSLSSRCAERVLKLR